MKTIIMLAACASFLPGCIAWEIRDEMRTANRQLCDANPSLVHAVHGMESVNQDIVQTNAQLAQVQILLERTNGQLTDVYALLKKTDEDLVAVGGTLNQTQPKMTSLDGQLERMMVINDVQNQLKEVNSALGPLGKSLGSLGGAMSFLGMGSSGDVLDDEHPPAPAGSGQGAESAGAGTASGAGTGGPTSDAALMRRELLAGTWIQVYPPPTPPRTSGRVLVLMGDGGYLQAEEGQPLISGKWKREGRTATLTPEGASGGGGAQGAAAGAGAGVEKFDLVTLSAQTLTLRQGDSIRVFARP